MTGYKQNTLKLYCTDRKSSDCEAHGKHKPLLSGDFLQSLETGQGFPLRATFNYLSSHPKDTTHPPGYASRGSKMKCTTGPCSSCSVLGQSLKMDRTWQREDHNSLLLHGRRTWCIKGCAYGLHHMFACSCFCTEWHRGQLRWDFTVW